MNKILYAGCFAVPLAILTLVACARQTPPDPTYAGEWFEVEHPSLAEEYKRTKPDLVLNHDGSGKWVEMRIRWSVVDERSVVLAAPLDARTKSLATIGIGKIDGGVWKEEYKIVGPRKLELYNKNGELSAILEKRDQERL